MKFIKNCIRTIKKLDGWSKSVLFLSILLLTIITINKYQEPIGVEAFTQREKYVLKQNNDIYDEFYCDIYDDLVLDEVKNKYEVDEIVRITKYFVEKRTSFNLSQQISIIEIYNLA